MKIIYTYIYIYIYIYMLSQKWTYANLLQIQCLLSIIYLSNMSAGVYMHASFRDVTIKIPAREYDQGCESRHAPEEWAEIWEKSVSWVPAREEEGWLSELVVARRLCALLAPRFTWVESWRCKSSQHRRIMSLSPYVEKPLNSKVIKSFVPELRSRKCFSCFGIPMLSIYELWTFYASFAYSYMSMLHAS